jgi:hypothetical protein
MVKRGDIAESRDLAEDPRGILGKAAHVLVGRVTVWVGILLFLPGQVFQAVRPPGNLPGRSHCAPAEAVLVTLGALEVPDQLGEVQEIISHFNHLGCRAYRPWLFEATIQSFALGPSTPDCSMEFAPSSELMFVIIL